MTFDPTTPKATSGQSLEPAPAKPRPAERDRDQPPHPMHASCSVCGWDGVRWDLLYQHTYTCRELPGNRVDFWCGECGLWLGVELFESLEVLTTGERQCPVCPDRHRSAHRAWQCCLEDGGTVAKQPIRPSESPSPQWGEGDSEPPSESIEPDPGVLSLFEDGGGGTP